MLWVYRTAHGLWSIRQIGTHFHACFDGQSLGAYHTAIVAVEELSNGHTFWTSEGIDPGTCGLPDALEFWQHIAPPQNRP